jgi:hypothetical protein
MVETASLYATVYAHVLVQHYAHELIIEPALLHVAVYAHD